MKHRIFFFLTAVLISGSPLLGQEKPDATQKPRKVKVEPAAMRVLSETISSSGTAMAVKHSRLNFQVPGVVSEVLVEMGERVTKNTPLAKLDDTNYKLRVEQAQAGLTAASATLEKLKAGFRPEEIAQAQAGVEAAQASLEKFTAGFRAEDIKAAEAAFAAAQAAYKQAERNYERMKNLFEEKKAIAEATFEEAKTQYEIARAQRDQAEQRLETFRSGYEQADVESLKARFKQAAEQLALLKKGFRQEDITAASAQVSVAQAALKIAQKSLDDTVLRAPYDGVVVKTHVNPGDNVSNMPGQVVVEIADITELEIYAPVPAKWSGVLTTDATAVLDLDSGPKNIKAKITAVSPAIDVLSRTFNVKIMLGNPALKLKAGMFAQISIIHNKTRVLCVPSTAILEEGKDKFVMSLNNNTALKTMVQTGIIFEGYTEITSGITEGTTVIHEGNFGLANGSPVETAGDK